MTSHCQITSIHQQQRAPVVICQTDHVLKECVEQLKDVFTRTFSTSSSDKNNIPTCLNGTTIILYPRNLTQLVWMTITLWPSPQEMWNALKGLSCNIISHISLLTPRICIQRKPAYKRCHYIHPAPPQSDSPAIQKVIRILLIQVNFLYYLATAACGEAEPAPCGTWYLELDLGLSYTEMADGQKRKKTTQYAEYKIALKGVYSAHYCSRCGYMTALLVLTPTTPKGLLR